MESVLIAAGSANSRSALSELSKLCGLTRQSLPETEATPDVFFPKTPTIWF